MEYVDVVQSLKDLSQLHAAGVLSNEEFAQAKRQVIEGSGQVPPPAPGLGPMAPGPADAPTVVRPRYGFAANLASEDAAETTDRPALQAVSLAKTPPPAMPPAMPAGPVQIPAQRADALPWNGQWGPPAGSGAGQPPFVPLRPQHGGAIAAAIAAVLAAGSFLLLPMVAVGPFGATGSRLASLGSLPGGGGFYALWLIPAAAAAVLILALRQLMEPAPSASGRKATLILLIILATATALAYLAMLVVVQEKLSSAGAGSIGISVLDLAGTGFWVALSSTVAAAIAGGVELGANRGMSGTMRPPIGAPAPPVSVGRNVAAMATAVAVVVAMVGVAIWNVRSSPTTPEQNLTALEGQGSSSGGGQGSSLGSGDSSGDSSGSSTGSSSGEGSTPVEDAANFVENYYNLLPGSPDAAWAMLSPDAQATSGSQQAFDAFWSGISAVSLENVQTLDQSTVEATVDFTRTDGSWTREDYRFSISESNGQQVIQTASQLKVLSSGGGSSSQGASGGSSSTGLSSMGIVDVSAVSSDPRAGEIGAALDEYFSGINQRNWTQALSALDPRVVDQSDPNAVARFEHAESTTTDSDVVVQSIQANSDAPNGESATVTFRSNQDPSLGPEGESCTLWRLDYQFSDAAGVSVYIYKSKGTHAPC